MWGLILPAKESLAGETEVPGPADFQLALIVLLSGAIPINCCLQQLREGGDHWDTWYLGTPSNLPPSGGRRICEKFSVIGPLTLFRYHNAVTIVAHYRSRQLDA